MERPVLLEAQLSRWPVFATLGVYAVYALGLIWAGSFQLEGERFFVLFDDAMISMRYARHWAEGIGPFYNLDGERVEGFTNPLWTALMALVHLLPLPVRWMSLPVQILGLTLLTLNLLVCWRLARGLAGTAAAWAAGILCAAYLPLNFFGLYGMEVGLLALLLGASVLLLWERREAEPWDVRPWVLLGLATAVRLDMVVPALALAAWRHRNLPGGRRPFLATLGVLAAFLAVQFFWRWNIYGELLPNTYYLKMGGFPVHWRLARGAAMLGKFMLHGGFLFFVAAFWMAWQLRARGAGLLAWAFSAQCAYSVYVGGDAWEWWGGANRYICIVMPIFFVLLGSVLAEIAGWVPRAWRPIALVCLVVLAAVRLNMLDGTTDRLQEWALQRPPLNLDGNAKFTRQAREALAYAAPGAKVTVSWAGTVPYFFPEYHYIDLLGKNDRQIARAPMRGHSGLPGAAQAPAYLRFYPGHLKWDYDYSIGRLKPDVVFDLWTSLEEADPYLRRDYVAKKIGGRTVYYNRNSRLVDWVRLERGASR
jgi:arabinofuranosyltransferase